MAEERDEYKIWQSRWEGRQVDTPDGPGVCCGFLNDVKGYTGVAYQVRVQDAEGKIVWREYPKAKVKLLKRSGL